MSNYAKQIAQMQQAKTPEELQAIVQRHGGIAKGGMMTDPVAEAEAMRAAVKLYQATGLGYNHAAQAAELLFYAKANPVWSELITAEAATRNAAIMEAARRKEAEPDTRTIDPVKLKSAAEYLEWVLRQYPESEDIQGLLHVFTPLIESAKSGLVEEPIDRAMVPCAYAFSNRDYFQYHAPSVEGAYYDFAAELRGGRDSQEKQLIADVEAMNSAGDLL